VTRTAAYRYRAARSDGALELGAMESESRDAAARAIMDRGLYPITINLDNPIVERRGKVSADELALGLRLLAELIEAGLPISRVFAAFSDLAPSAWRRGLPALQEDVRQGKGLASALANSPLEIPAVVVGLIQAGEAGAGLAPAVRSAADLAHSAAATRRAIRSALAYPIVLACAGLTSLGLLVGVVLPRFAQVLSESGQAIPPVTALVLGTAGLARAGVVPVVALLAIGLLVWRAWANTDSGLRQWHGLLLRLPLIGSVRRSAAVSRAAATISALLDAGVPVAPALLHSARAAGDAELGARLCRVREAVLVGQGVARSLEDENAMTPTAVRLVRAGEETGRLAEMLAQTARIEEAAAQRAVRAAVRLLEPTLIITFGAIVALVAAGLLQAVYGVRVS